MSGARDGIWDSLVLIIRPKVHICPVISYVSRVRRSRAPVTCLESLGSFRGVRGGGTLFYQSFLYNFLSPGGWVVTLIDG